MKNNEMKSPCPSNMYFVKNEGYYFSENDDGPYCMYCLEKNGKLFHLGKDVNYNDEYCGRKYKEWITWQCPECNERWHNFKFEED